MDKIMGNQQGTVSDRELSWLAGIFDGEGSIGLSRLMCHRKNPTITPRISLGNTNPKIIKEVRRIFRKIPVTYFVEKRQKVSGKNWKDAEVLQISHIQGSQDLLRVLNPYLIGKKLQAKTLLAFVNSRMNIYKKLGRIPGSGGRGTPYTIKEMQLFEKLRILNRKGIETDSSTTTRQSPKNRVKI